MSLLVTLLPALADERLRHAVREHAEIVACETWEELRGACDRHAPAVAVIDLFHGGAVSFDALRDLRQRFPRLPILGYVGDVSGRELELFDAGRAGVNGLAIAGRNDSPVELLALLALSESRSFAEVVRRAISGIDPLVYDAVLICVTRAYERLSPESLARLLRAPRRTLAHRLATLGFPPPLRLIAWGRLMVAAGLLEDANRSAESVAQALDFPSGSAFRNTCQRYLGVTPKALRELGGALFVARQFFTAVRGAAGRTALGRLETVAARA